MYVAHNSGVFQRRQTDQLNQKIKWQQHQPLVIALKFIQESVCERLFLTFGKEMPTQHEILVQKFPAHPYNILQFPS